MYFTEDVADAFTMRRFLFRDRFRQETWRKEASILWQCWWKMDEFRDGGEFILRSFHNEPLCFVLTGWCGGWRFIYDRTTKEDQGEQATDKWEAYSTLARVTVAASGFEGEALVLKLKMVKNWHISITHKHLQFLRLFFSSYCLLRLDEGVSAQSQWCRNGHR